MAKRPSVTQTAFGPMVIAAIDQYSPAPQRLTEDEVALRLLPSGMRLTVWACRRRPLRKLLIKATEAQGTGLWASMLCRKRYADEKVRDALEAGIEQFVFLGAGLDTRAGRLVVPSGASAFEVDLPANITCKRRRLDAVYGRVPGRLTLIPLGLETGDLAGARGGRPNSLKSAGNRCPLYLHG